MASQDFKTDPLRSASVEEFRGHEAEMLRRIAETPNGGRLLCLDPQRLLADIGVEMTPECAQEARLSHPEFFGPTGREHAYDTTAACAPDGSVSVTVSGLFRGAST